MQVRWEQIDPLVAESVGGRLAQWEENGQRLVSETRSSFVPAAATPAETVVWTIISLFAAIGIMGLYLAVCFHASGATMTTLLSLLPVGIVGGATAAGRISPSKATHRNIKLRGVLHLSDGLRWALADTSQGKAEQLYGEIVLLLAADKSDIKRKRRALTESEIIARELLREANVLIADHHRLAAQRRRVRDLWDNGASVTRAEAERAELVRRLDAQDDPIARRSLKESVALCTSRLGRLRALGPLLARLDAHEEAISQGLLLAQATLLGQQAAPLALHAPNLAGLRQTVERAVSQTRAVEEAVAEITQI